MYEPTELQRFKDRLESVFMAMLRRQRRHPRMDKGEVEGMFMDAMRETGIQLINESTVKVEGMLSQ